MLMLLLLAAAAAPGDGKTMAMDDWHQLAIYGVGGDASGPIYLQVHAGDLDGDGTSDDAVLKLSCADGLLSESSYQISPRDAGSGMPTGKRQHGTVTIVKEWGAATPQLMAMKASYDVKKVEGTGARAKTMIEDSWNSISLADSEDLCAAAAAARATKTRSNIQNN